MSGASNFCTKGSGKVQTSSLFCCYRLQWICAKTTVIPCVGFEKHFIKYRKNCEVLAPSLHR